MAALKQVWVWIKALAAWVWPRYWALPWPLRLIIALFVLALVLRLFGVSLGAGAPEVPPEPGRP